MLVLQLLPNLFFLFIPILIVQIIADLFISLKDWPPESKIRWTSAVKITLIFLLVSFMVVTVFLIAYASNGGLSDDYALGISNNISFIAWVISIILLLRFGCIVKGDVQKIYLNQFGENISTNLKIMVGIVAITFGISILVIIVCIGIYNSFDIRILR